MFAKQAALPTFPIEYPDPYAVSAQPYSIQAPQVEPEKDGFRPAYPPDEPMLEEVKQKPRKQSFVYNGEVYPSYKAFKEAGNRLK